MIIEKTVPGWQRSLVILSGTVVAFLVVVALEWGRPVLIPIALAVLLTFLLNPIVKALHRRGMSQTVSVMIAVSIAGIIVMGLGWFVSNEVTGMVSDLPRSTTRIKAKVKSLKELVSGPAKERIGQMIEEISEEISKPLEQTKASSPQPDAESSVDPQSGLVVVSKEAMPWSSLTGYVGSAFEILATLAFSLVLLVFFLIEREDLRDRIILLAGRAKLALTSKAIEDISDRISRYIGMVAMVNGGFGLVLTIGLLVLHVPYALLWGFIAATLRFLPYIGPWVGAIFPITMSLALSEGWGQPISVFVFVAVVELVTNNFVEPLLFGHTIGVSPTALLVSAATWLYLWGPIGLVLSAPFAVCLVVLGKNIPQLSFLYLLMGDKPAFDADYSYYQRLLLEEFEEGLEIAQRRIKETSEIDTFDEMLVPALNLGRRDVQRDYLKREDEDRILQGMRFSLERLSDADKTDGKSGFHFFSTGDQASTEDIQASPSAQRIRILGCPATDDTDRVALELLSRFLDPSHWDLELTALETLTSELVARIHEDPPGIVVIASVPPGGLSHCRYLCKRLRNASADLQILVARLGQRRSAKHDRELLEQAGANLVTTTLHETVRMLNTRRTLLPCQHADASSANVKDIDEISMRGHRRELLVGDG